MKSNQPNQPSSDIPGDKPSTMSKNRFELGTDCPADFEAIYHTDSRENFGMALGYAMTHINDDYGIDYGTESFESIYHTDNTQNVGMKIGETLRNMGQRIAHPFGGPKINQLVDCYLFKGKGWNACPLMLLLTSLNIYYRYIYTSTL